ncbi:MULTISPECIES: aminofutalosine synthase MqnE [unclassified Nitratiruptor]|uniref:aminofutalosine synthase MqnE n=1 Tax=unclassified Nitratiruptor TaxID=2624044 RepID=UPI001915A137|nr:MULTISPECIES: aminofutalosine synthase MqnE [unclassified Nitratiruptor]BCD59948.1 aminodeoxyfutalosine synthase [Nitratiruptor sp. YY08-10]BCD63871.1 aminodeoxyfutalosine synthase [Nitratiruptor sp. YY08-14]
MELIEKLETGARLGFEDGVKLYDLDLFTLAKYADRKRKSLYGKKSFFNINRHINPTNICKDICKFCAFSANRKNPNPYTLSHDEILAIVEEATQRGIKEVHIVSAHNDQVGLDWYLGIFKKIKEQFPQIHIKALTAAEVNFLAKEHGMSYDEMIELMIENGVDSMPGGGAEIFDEEVRDYICKGKVSSDEWLQIHKLWHQKGRKSNATMLFGHIENRAHRIDHMLRLRNLQDETGGFNCFIPLVYQKENNYLKVENFVTGQEYLKTIAIARLILDNIPHIKAYWATSTLNLALVAQEFGADDLDGTIEKEAIQSAAGAPSKNGIPLEEFVHLIKDSGFIPVERDSLYNELKVW